MSTIIANMKRAAFDREHIFIGGGTFSPEEIKTFVNSHDALLEALKYLSSECFDPLDESLLRPSMHAVKIALAAIAAAESN